MNKLIAKLSNEENRELGKKLSKEIATKVFVTVTVAVASHFIASAIIGALESSDDDTTND